MLVSVVSRFITSNRDPSDDRGGVHCLKKPEQRPNRAESLATANVRQSAQFVQAVNSTPPQAAKRLIVTTHAGAHEVGAEGRSRYLTVTTGADGAAG
jgi:hypothetical protein